MAPGDHWKDVVIPAAYSKEFRADVVAVARKGEIPITQVTKDFGITESCLCLWLAQDDVEAGIKPGVTHAEGEELKKAKCRGRPTGRGSTWRVERLQRREQLHGQDSHSQGAIRQSAA